MWMWYTGLDKQDIISRMHSWEIRSKTEQETKLREYTDRQAIGAGNMDQHGLHAQGMRLRELTLIHYQRDATSTVYAQTRPFDVLYPFGSVRFLVFCFSDCITYVYVMWPTA